MPFACSLGSRIVPDFRAGFGTLAASQVAGRSQGQSPHATLDELLPQRARRGVPFVFLLPFFVNTSPRASIISIFAREALSKLSFQLSPEASSATQRALITMEVIRFHRSPGW